MIHKLRPLTADLFAPTEQLFTWYYASSSSTVLVTASCESEACTALYRDYGLVVKENQLRQVVTSQPWTKDLKNESNGPSINITILP